MKTTTTEGLINYNKHTMQPHSSVAPEI